MEITISPNPFSRLAISIALALYPHSPETSVDYPASVIYQENANGLSGASLTCGDLVRFAFSTNARKAQAAGLKRLGSVFM